MRAIRNAADTDLLFERVRLSRSKVTGSCDSLKHLDLLVPDEST